MAIHTVYANGPPYGLFPHSFGGLSSARRRSPSRALANHSKPLSNSVAPSAARTPARVFSLFARHPVAVPGAHVAARRMAPGHGRDAVSARLGAGDAPLPLSSESASASTSPVGAVRMSVVRGADAAGAYATISISVDSQSFSIASASPTNAVRSGHFPLVGDGHVRPPREPPGQLQQGDDAHSSRYTPPAARPPPFRPRSVSRRISAFSCHDVAPSPTPCGGSDVGSRCQWQLKTAHFWQLKTAHFPERRPSGFDGVRTTGTACARCTERA